VDPKPRPNHEIYLVALRRMTPEQRLLKAFELTEQSHELPAPARGGASPMRGQKSSSVST